MNGIFHPKTITSIEKLCENIPHAIGLIGMTGVGKKFTAKELSKKITSNHNKHSTIIIKPDKKGTIGIEATNSILEFIKLKDAGNNTRIVQIIDAHFMTNEAQNAILKTLEESPPKVIFILTLLSKKSVLDTIASRLTFIDISTPPKNELNKFFCQKFNKNDVAKAIMIANSRPGLVYSLLTDSNHTILNHINDSKDFLKKNTYQRLTMIDSLSKKPTDFLEALNITSGALLENALQKSDRKAIEKFLHNQQYIIRSQKKLLHNNNPKLVLADLFLKYR